MPVLRLVLLLLALAVAPACAETWRVTLAVGAPSQFQAGAWAALKPGDTLPERALVRTGDADRLELESEAGLVALGPGAELQTEDGLDGKSLNLRAHAGVIAVRDHGASTKPLRLFTPFMVVAAPGAAYAVTVEKQRSGLVVAQGAATAMEIAHGVRREVASPGFAFVPLQSGKSLEVADPSLEVARRLADSLGAAPLAPAEPTASSLPEFRAAAENARAEPEPAGWFDYVTDPAHMVWTEAREGEAVMIPLLKLALGLRGADAWLFWPGVLFGYLLAGFLIQMALGEMGFGGLGNTVLALAWSAAGLTIRDAGFVSASFLAYEPLLSLGLVLAPIPFVVVLVRLAANRVV